MIEHTIIHQSPCSYLLDTLSEHEYKYIIDCPTHYSKALLERGWRRFGYTFFRPICPSCTQCETMRILVNEFTPTSSMKRLIRKNSHIDITIGKPSLNTETLLLYNKFHKERSQSRGWDYKDMTAHEYYKMAIEGANEYGFEARYYNNQILIGVDLLDIYSDAISSLYFFSDPDYKKLSLGTFSLLKQIEWATLLNIPYVYPGYVVRNNQSLSYKTRYKPFEILLNRPLVSNLAQYIRD